MKLVRIKDVRLCTTERNDDKTTAECVKARELLTQHGIQFEELWYNDANVDERTPALAALSTWSWGPEGSAVHRQFTAFPVLYWTECNDDWSTHRQHAMGLSEIQACSLLANKALIK